ncbi:transposase, partial [Arthrospira platensis SPKY1]|nr:transposase [Arthrospira platensis SPKY1]
MKKEELLNDDFLKQFKNGEELNSFIDQLRKRGVEQLLEGELDAHLGYGKHERSNTTNARNGHSKKVVKTKEGTLEIKVPRDRDATFNPMLIPKRKSL